MHRMSYLRDRLIQAAVTLYGIVTFSFFLQKSMPGGPIEFLEQDMYQNPGRYGLSTDPDPQVVQATIERLTKIPPEKPIHEAYVDYMVNVLFHFDFGYSIVVSAGVPVTELVLARAPWTIFLSTLGLIYGIIVGITLGAVMAYYEGTKFDIGMTWAMILDRSIPYYIAAIFLLYVFAFQLNWFPTGGRVNADLEPGLNVAWIMSVWYHATLPALSTIITGFGAGALGMRANSIRLIGSDYVRNAQLRGLTDRQIVFTYIGRNAVLPMWTSIIVGLGALLGGSAILEMIYQYPGMGLLMYEAAIMRDFPLLMGVLVMTSVLFVLGTILADFTYPLIDPRADMKKSRE